MVFHNYIPTHLSHRSLIFNKSLVLPHFTIVIDIDPAFPFPIMKQCEAKELRWSWQRKKRWLSPLLILIGSRGMGENSYNKNVDRAGVLVPFNSCTHGLPALFFHAQKPNPSRQLKSWLALVN